MGSFVWTHLTNHQESHSQSPSKRHLKKLIGNDFLKNKWNTDARKFSRFYETSYFSKELNIGTTADGSVVFSQDSYMPRSARLNLTFNVFGESLNLMELGARVEGFEGAVEDAFGQDGYFREDTFHKVLQGLRRDKRDQRSEIAGFQQTFNKYREEQPRGNVYMRMFGKDIAYDSFNGFYDLAQRFMALPKSVASDGDGFNYQIDVAKSSIFLDGGIVLPTAAGLPLGLNVNGTYSLSLGSKLNTNVTSDGAVNVEAQIYPTGTVEIVGLMSVDAFVTKTGLKSVSRMHSSTFLDGNVVFRGNKLLNVAFNMPRESMEVFEASVDFFTHQNGAFLQLQSDHEAEVASICSPEFISDLLALKGCAALSYHSAPATQDNTMLMFAGPSKLTIGLSKTDDFDRHRFKYEYLVHEDKPQRSLHVSLDTQGRTRKSHRTSLEVAFHDRYEFMSFKLQFPHKDLKATAKYEWNSDKKAVKAALSSEGRNIASAYAAFMSDQHPGQYEVLAKVSRGEDHLLNWKGTLNVQDGKASLDGKVEGSFHQPVQVTGDWEFINDRLSMGSSLRSSALTADLGGVISFGDSSASFRSDLSFKLSGNSKHMMAVDAKYSNSMRGFLATHDLFLALNVSTIF